MFILSDMKAKCKQVQKHVWFQTFLNKTLNCNAKQRPLKLKYIFEINVLLESACLHLKKVQNITINLTKHLHIMINNFSMGFYKQVSTVFE